jgi:CheY-like chemotaxis protein
LLLDAHGLAAEPGLAAPLKQRLSRAGTEGVLVTPFSQRRPGDAALKAGIRTSIHRPVHAASLRRKLAELAESAPREATPGDAPAGGPRVPEGDCRILLVDDNKINRKVALAQLKRAGVADVELAANGQEAVEAVERSRFDLVLMDCQMPVMDGYEAATLIRSREAEHGTGHLPIVALTADVMEEARSRCLEAGMDDYLAKPIKPAQLVEAVKRWTARGEAP